MLNSKSVLKHLVEMMYEVRNIYSYKSALKDLFLFFPLHVSSVTLHEFQWIQTRMNSSTCHKLFSLFYLTLITS